MPDQPAPLVICGPSGVGKSVLIQHLQATFPEKFGFSVSHTTRAPRPGEQDGVHYHFTRLEDMERGVAAGEFLEFASVHGNMYGTSREAVEHVARLGKICILDIDVQGAERVQSSQAFKDVRFIFLHPPSFQELERRLRGRGTETEEKVQKRLGAASREIELSVKLGFFDHAFVLEGLEKNKPAPACVRQLLVLLQSWYPSLGVVELSSLRSRKILNSLGLPAMEVDARTAQGLFRAAATGDVHNVPTDKLVGLDVREQRRVDEVLAGVDAALAVSMAVCRAGAAAFGVPLYEYVAMMAGRRTDTYTLPTLNIVVMSGGSLLCRQLLVVPKARSLKEGVVAGAEVYHALKGILKKRYGQDACNVGDEGAFGVPARKEEEALDCLMEAVESSGNAGKVGFGVRLVAEGKSDEELVDAYKGWCAKYPLVSVDAEDEVCSRLTSEFGQEQRLVRAGCLAADAAKFQAAVESGAGNALLLTLADFSTVTDIIDTVNAARRKGWAAVLCSSAGETEDTFLSDLAVGLHIGQVRAGAPCRSEWVSKYNALIRIEEELGLPVWQTP